MGCFGLFRQVKFSVRLQHSVRFLHNSEGNLIYGKSIQGECSENALVYFHCRAAVFCVLHNSKEMKILYDWRGMVRQEQNSLNYFGARYLDPMLGMWISVDPKRQFASPYLYAGNGYNPVNIVDPDGNAPLYLAVYFNKKNSGGRNAKYNAQESVRRLKRNISNRVDTELNQVEVRAFAEGEAMEMMEWLNESGSEGFRAIMTHGGKGRKYITYIPFTDDDNPGKHRISYDELELHLRPTFIGQCYGKENIDTKKYPSLIPPSEEGIVSVEKAAAEYLINNATKKTEENE